MLIEVGKTILKASLKAGIHHYHDCGGKGQCKTWHVLIKEGLQLLTPPNKSEQDIIATISMPENVRLAWQTYVNGPSVKLHRIIRDEGDIAMYIGNSDDDNDIETGTEKELALFFLDIRELTPFIQTFLPFDVIHIMRRLVALFRMCI